MRSRNLAGRNRRPFSSRRGLCVPRNTVPPSLPPVRGPTALWFPPLYSTNTPTGTPFRNQTSYFWMFLQVMMVVQSGGQITAPCRERRQRRAAGPTPRAGYGLDTGWIRAGYGLDTGWIRAGYGPDTGWVGAGRRAGRGWGGAGR